MQHVRAIEFDENGVPQPVLRQPITSARMTRLLACALTDRYEPMTDPLTGEILPGEEKMIGLTNVEVGALKQARAFAQGDIDSAKFVFDRIVGKPKQQIEQLSVTTSLQDYLQMMAKQDDMFFDADTMESPDEAEDTDYQASTDYQALTVDTTSDTVKLAVEAPSSGASHILINTNDKYSALDGI